MLLRYLRYILGVGAVLAWLTPALAQQAGDPLTRLLDSFFKPPAGQSGNAQPGASEQPRPAPRAAPAPRAQPAARAQQPSQAEPGKAPPQKAAGRIIEDEDTNQTVEQIVAWLDERKLI